MLLASSAAALEAIMAKDDLASIEGTVSKLVGGGSYQITLQNGIVITAKLCGKMQRFRIRVVMGDRVTVGVSPYDPSHGLILLRHK